MEPWEALDLDDSDLPSILRPCKRHQSQQPQFPPDSFSNPNFPSQHCAPTSPSPSADNQPPPSPRLIPGPAGAMQSAMDRLGYRGVDFSRNRDAKICTQDYIRMVEEDDAEEFTSDHWLSALDFISREGVRRTTSLNDVKKCVNTEKIDMVVAMIKCCTPNGLGDLVVVLKDPTNSIHASIHRKVLAKGDYGKLIAVGSVLILQKVSVFSPLNKSFYLNISLSNVVKVIPKDAGRETLSVCTARDAAPDYHKNSKIPEQVSSGSGRAPEANSDVQLNYNSNGTQSFEKHVGEEDLALGSQINVDQNSNKYASLQHRFMRDHSGSTIMKKPTEVVLVSFSQEAGIQPDIDLRDENIVENLDDEHLSAANAFQKQARVREQTPTENFVGEELGRKNGVETQWQAKSNRTGEINGFEKHNNLSQSKASFQQWTDDQLDILDMDD